MKVRNILFFIALCFIACGSVKIDKRLESVEQDSDNRILWVHSKKLSWDDFKGSAKQDRGNKNAETVGLITTENAHFNDGIPRFEIKAYFLKNESWTVTDNQLTLEHEQIHFDIFELYARRIRKSFDSLNLIRTNDPKIYENVFGEFLLKNEKLHNTYDDNVRLDRSKQEAWQTKIAKELEELKEYEYVPKE